MSKELDEIELDLEKYYKRLVELASGNAIKNTSIISSNKSQNILNNSLNFSTFSSSTPSQTIKQNNSKHLCNKGLTKKQINEYKKSIWKQVQENERREASKLSHTISDFDL